jgi:hypothetical protein
VELQDEEEEEEEEEEEACYIHWMICKHMGLQVTDKYCEHIPKRVINVH